MIPPVAALQHVSVEVRRSDVDACVAFYALLGFERVDPPASLAERAAWMQGAATQVHLMHVEEPTTLPHGHVAVVVDRYDEVLDALGQAGHEPERRTQHWGSPRAYVRDPAGNRVEVMAFPPAG
jgi:catechol 2,3-dioxygenase-like lactoylglutathione lyase family enzyme